MKEMENHMENLIKDPEKDPVYYIEASMNQAEDADAVLAASIHNMEAGAVLNIWLRQQGKWIKLAQEIIRANEKPEPSMLVAVVMTFARRNAPRINAEMHMLLATQELMTAALQAQ